MFLSFSADNSESNSRNNLAQLERFCVHFSTRSPHSEFSDLLWSSLRIVVEGEIPSTRFLKIYPTPDSCCCCLRTDFTSGSLRKMRKHIEISSSLGTDDSFLSLGIFRQSISPRMGDNRGKFLIKGFFLGNFVLKVTPSCRSWEGCISFFSSFCNWFQQIQHGVLHIFFPFKVSLGSREFNGWYCLLQPRGRSFRCCIRSPANLLIIWEFLLAATITNNQAPFPTIALMVKLQPNVPVDKRHGPWCRPLLACLRPQCHWGLSIHNLAWLSSSHYDSEKLIPSCVMRRHCQLCTSFLWNVLPSRSRYSSCL